VAALFSGNRLRQFLAALVVRHLEDQSLAALEKAVAAGHFFLPVFFREFEIALLVEFEGVLRGLAAEDVELAADHLPGIGIAAPGNAVGDAVGAIAAVLRQVLLRLRSNSALCSALAKRKVTSSYTLLELRIALLRTCPA
jgi:hypothetical protein